MTIYDELELRNAVIQKQLRNLEQELKGMPPGELRVAKNEKRYKWYLVNQDKHYEYLPKSEEDLACILSYKKYLQLQIQQLETEQRAIKQFLKIYHHDKNKLNRFMENEGYQWLLQSALEKKWADEKINQSTYFSAKRWAEESYESNPYYAEHKIHETLQKRLVRSKTEGLIGTILEMKGIPYRYEWKLDLDGKIIYPDFTIPHPITYEMKYWEHFGMMDDEGYRKSNLGKLDSYCKAGIYPGKNLIITYETKNHPLSPTYIERTIEQYFGL